MATTRIVLRKNKTNKRGLAPLYIRISKNKKSSFISTGIYIEPNQWNSNKDLVRSNHDNYERLNSYLQQKLADALDATLKAERNSKYVPAKTLKAQVMGDDPVPFFPFADKFIKTYEAKGKIGTHKRFAAVISKMKKFCDEHKFTFNDLTLEFLKEYENYLRQEPYKNSVNTINANFRCIRRIINEAILQDKIEYALNPFLKYRATSISTEKVFLTEEELAKIENYALEPGSMKYHHRNMYIFACYAGGIRISDLIQLKWENYDGKHVLLTTQKTGSVVSILLPEKAKKIIEEYRNEDIKKDDFIFPFLDKSDDLKNPKILLSRISSITSYTNNDLKDIGNKLELGKHIHFHTSRHTWATRALKKGMRIEYVSKLMGHSSIRTTQVYAKIVNADLDKAMEVFDEKPELPKKPPRKTKKST
ncbi:MAG: site-specific integrase [Bacteroidales bacterium]|jgi:integrase